MTNLTKKYEGLRLKAYKCPKGIWTIGYGTTIYPDGSRVKELDEITNEKAEIYLNHHMIHEVYPAFDKIPYKLTEGQKDALSSLIYNWSLGGFLNSKLYKACCKKDWANVCREWDFGFKNNLLGLFKRRTDELHTFMKDIE